MKKKEIKGAIDDIYTRYANTLEMLEQAVDKIESLEKIILLILKLKPMI